MNKTLATIMDKVMTQGMKILESEQAQKILSSDQAQTALELGLKTLGVVQEKSESLKAMIAESLGVVTKVELESLRDEIKKLQAINRERAKDAKDAEKNKAKEAKETLKEKTKEKAAEKAKDKAKDAKATKEDGKEKAKDAKEAADDKSKEKTK
ncbi:MAG: hypothetical protein WC966_08720 [Bradymonadales bacterium]|jgi:hypothetical protein